MDRWRWGRALGVRPEEQGRFAYFFLIAVVLSLGGTLGLVGSEALFLTHVGPSALPYTLVVASLSALAASLAYATVVGRVRNDQLLSGLLTMGGVLLFFILARARAGGDSGWVMLFCSFYVFQAVYINLHFWTFATDFFDTLESKRLFPLLAVGASLGGFLGGSAGALLGAWVSAEALIVAWAVTLVGLGGVVFGTRHRLMHWRVLDSVEADESSAEGMRGALDFMANSRLARWLALSVVGMVVALTVMQYVYLDIFAHAFDDSRELAAFFGVFLAITNASEIALGGLLTPFLVRRFGVARANLIHPLATAGVFVLLVLDPRLWVAMLARMNREMVENSLAGPIRVLFYNALPLRFRGRMRALLEGVFLFAAMSIAGVGLVLIQGTGMAWGVGWVGGSAALVYLAANGRVRGEYLRSLVEEIRRGRLDLTDWSGTVTPALVGRLAGSWEDFVSAEQGSQGPALRDLALLLARHGYADRVRAHLGDSRKWVREVCLEALVEAGGEDVPGVLCEGMRDPQEGIRRRCLDWIDQVGVKREASLREALTQCLLDEDADVRAHAASLLGEAGLSTLEDLLRDPERSRRRVAMRYVPASFDQVIRSNLDLGDDRLRASALAALQRLGLPHAVPLEALKRDLDSAEVELREVAVDLLASSEGPQVTEWLISGLGDPERRVRARVQARLGEWGEAGWRAVEGVCRSPDPTVARAALEVIRAGAGRKDREATLGVVYEARVREAWKCRLALQEPEFPIEDDSGFLAAAIADAEKRNRNVAFSVLEQWEDPSVVRSLARVLERGSGKGRADALEVLSNLALRPVSAHFALLLESSSASSRAAELRGFASAPQDGEALVEWVCEADDPWLNLAGRLHRESRSRGGPDWETSQALGEEARQVERLLALQKVTIFSGLSLDQLHKIDSLLCEQHFVSGEVVVAEGDHGEDLYILMEGQVDFYKSWQRENEVLLSELSPFGYLGEMALLDDEPRSATAVARQDCRFLTLSGIRFRELLTQAPEMGFEVLRALTSRIRAAEKRLDERGEESVSS